MGIRMQGHVYVLDTLLNYWKKLLYLLVSTRAVIGQFSGRTLLHGPLKFKVFWLPNRCAIYYQIFSTYANNSLKLSFTLDCVLKRVNDLKTI